MGLLYPRGTEKNIYQFVYQCHGCHGGSKRTENFAVVEVEDNGKGMKAEEKERIFNPFYTTKSTGTGLGLYLVYQQLEEVGGSIQVYSEEGQGTLFRVMLPLKKSLGE